MANLYDKAGLVNIPVGYQEGFLYNIKPEDNTLGFRFNRDSAATRVNKEGLIEQVGYFGPELIKNGNFSELGPELVTNGDFATDSDWDLSNSVIENGVLKLNGTSGTVRGRQDINFTGQAKITYTISFNNTSQTTIQIREYGGANAKTVPATVGTHTVYKDFASDGVSFQATSFPVGEGIHIDNVSVKQVDPNDYWTVGGSWSLSEDKADYLATGNGSSITQSNVFGNAGLYKISFTISNVASGQNARILIESSSEVYLPLTSLGNGNYVYYANATANNNLIIRGYTSGSGVAFSITDVSVTEVLGDKPRIDYTDSLTSPSFLLEPQSTNLLEFSENFSQSYWTKNAISVSSGVLASPDGTVSASKITEDSTINNHRIAVLGLTGSGTHTISVFAKANDRNWLLIRNSSSNAWFDVLNGVVGTVQNGSGSIENYGNGWYRCSVTMSSLNTPAVGVADNNDSYSYQGNGKGSLYIWGMQVEQESYPTSYIPTAGSTATRAQETCNGAGSASTFNSTEGVLYCEIAALANDGTSRQISLSDGSNANNKISLRYTSTTNELNAFVKSGGSTVFDVDEILSNTTQSNKLALKFKQNDFALWVNGVKVATDTSGNTPTGLNVLDFDSAIGTLNFYGRTKGVYVFNEALTDDELQQLTGPEYNSFAALAAAYNYTVI